MLETLKDAFVTAFKKPVTWVAIIGIPIIVGVFALLYVNTFIDPFERMKNVPIAVISEDAGAYVDGEYKNYGDELVDSICENDSAKWTVEDASLVDDGLENTDYMVAVIIPSDFSQKVSAGQTKEPEQANITFYKNMRKNYMFSTLSSRIESSLKETINNKISQQYISAYVEGLLTAGDGMQTASDGAGELASGLGTAKDGTSTLYDGMTQLDSGASSLKSGMSQLQTGASSLESGMSQLQSGASSLVSGMTQLQSGSGSLTDGMTQLQSGSGSLTSGMTQLQTGSGSLTGGMAQLQTGSSSLISGLKQLQTGAASLQEGAASAATGAASLAEGASQLSDGASQLASQGNTLSEGSTSAKEGISTLSSGIDTYASTLADKANAISSVYGGDPQTALPAAQAKYSEALQQYTANVVAAVQGGQDPSQVDASAVTAAMQSIVQISSHAGAYQALTQASEGSASIQQGASKLNESYVTLDSGIQDYVSAANTLSSGAASVSSGAQSLASGTGQIQSGAASLGSGIDSAASGASTLGSGIDSAASGASALSSGIDSAASGATSLSNGIDSAASGASALGSGIDSAASGSGTLASGIDSAASGVTSLGGGINSAASGAASLASGVISAKDGAVTLSSGITSAKDGASTLQNSLAEGSQTIDDSVTASSDEIGEYAASPVDTESDTFGDPGRFGFGFVPLFCALALWIGTLAAFFVFDPFPSSARLRRNRFAAVFARWPLYLVIAVLNAAVVAIGALVSGVPCADAVAYAVMFAAIALSFMCIMQLLNLFDVAGKALSVLLTVLQIVFCSGTFPAILGSDVAMAAGPCLPFYYAIDGLREAISGTNMQVAYCDAGMLLLFAAGATALSLITYPAALKMKKKTESYSAAALAAAAE